MEKDIKIKEYIERIREELSYRDYAHAKELCVRASNIDCHNLCIKYLREFIEMHKKQNGHYEELDILEMCAYLYKSREYVTAENWESLSMYCDCVADELFERERVQERNLLIYKEEYSFIRECRNSIIYLSNHVETLLKIIEEQQIEDKSINRLFKAVENLRNRLEKILNEVEQGEEERKRKEEEEKRKKERDRLISRWVLGISMAVIVIGMMIATCSGRMTW